MKKIIILFVAILALYAQKTYAVTPTNGNYIWQDFTFTTTHPMAGDLGQIVIYISADNTCEADIVDETDGRNFKVGMAYFTDTAHSPFTNYGGVSAPTGTHTFDEIGLFPSGSTPQPWAIYAGNYNWCFYYYATDTHIFYSDSSVAFHIAIPPPPSVTPSPTATPIPTASPTPAVYISGGGANPTISGVNTGTISNLFHLVITNISIFFWSIIAIVFDILAGLFCIGVIVYYVTKYIIGKYNDRGGYTIK